MRRSSEPDEPAQFSVAELLARYGEPTPTPGRRHRRAPEDTGTVADMVTQSAIEPNRIDNPPLPVADPPGRHGSVPQGSAPQGSTQSYLNGHRQWEPAVGLPSAAAALSAVPRSPVVPARPPLTATALSDGPATVQFPRLDPVPVKPASWPGSAAPPAGLGDGARAIPEQQTRDATEEPRDDEVQDPEHGSPIREWAVMVTQIGVGVVVGAALWLICEWLWQQIPVMALVVALAVITGLVWVVRRVRRAEDLQTTVIAVLVGLFVTVSPAALLLVGR
ncbi:MAG: hypothetical protein ACRDRP_10395 [Pseudonocardiaceae bacterium]